MLKPKISAKIPSLNYDMVKMLFTGKQSVNMHFSPDKGVDLSEASFANSEELVLPQSVHCFDATLGDDGRGHMVTDPARIVLLWPRYPVGALEKLDLAHKVLLMQKSCAAFEALLDLWSEKDSCQYFFAESIKTKLRPCAQLMIEYIKEHYGRDRRSDEGTSLSYTAVQEVMYGRAHGLTPKQIIDGMHPDDIPPINHEWVDLLRYRDLLHIGIDNLSKLGKGELQDQSLISKRLLRKAFPDLMKALEHSSDLAIVASALPHFIPPILGWRRIRAIGLPSAEHTKDGHLPNEITAAQCAFFHTFLPLRLRPPAERESVNQRALRLYGTAQHMRETFSEKHSWLTVDAGAGGEGCKVYLAPKKNELAPVAARLRLQRGQFKIPAGPHLLGTAIDETTRDAVVLSIESTSGSGLRHFDAAPEIAIGMHKCEYGYRLDEGWLDPWERDEQELTEACYRFLARTSSQRVSWRLYDDGEVEDMRGKVSVPADKKELFEERQIHALTKAAAKFSIGRRIHRLEIMIPNLEDTARYYRIRDVLQTALKTNRMAEELKSGAVSLIPQIEGPLGRKTLRELIGREERFGTISLGVSDLAQRECGAPSREVPDLRVFPPEALAAIKDICGLAGSIGARVCAAGHLAQPPANFALLLGLGIREIAIPPDNIFAMLEIVNKLSASDCARLVEQCESRPVLRDRVEAVDNLFGYREVNSNIWRDFAAQIRSGRDIFD